MIVILKMDLRCHRHLGAETCSREASVENIYPDFRKVEFSPEVEISQKR